MRNIEGEKLYRISSSLPAGVGLEGTSKPGQRHDKGQGEPRVVSWKEILDRNISALREGAAARNSESSEDVLTSLKEIKAIAAARNSESAQSAKAEPVESSEDVLTSLKEIKAIAAARNSESAQPVETDYEQMLKRQVLARAEKRKRETQRSAEFLATQRQQRFEFARDQYVQAYKEFYPNFNAQNRPDAIPPAPKNSLFARARFKKLEPLFQDLMHAKKELEEFGIGEKIRSNVERARQNYLGRDEKGVNFNDQAGVLSLDGRKSLIENAKANENVEFFSMANQNRSEGVNFTEEGWYSKENPELATGVSTEPAKKVSLWGKVKGLFSRSK